MTSYRILSSVPITHSFTCFFIYYLSIMFWGLLQALARHSSDNQGVHSVVQKTYQLYFLWFLRDDLCKIKFSNYSVQHGPTNVCDWQSHCWWKAPCFLHSQSSPTCPCSCCSTFPRNSFVLSRISYKWNITVHSLLVWLIALSIVFSVHNFIANIISFFKFIEKQYRVNRCTKVCPSVHQLINIRVVSSSELLRVTPWTALRFGSLCERDVFTFEG